MKTLLTLLLALCAASGYGQTIRTLGYNTTNGQVVANTGTNTLTFTNAGVAFGGDMTISGPVIAGSGVSFSFEDADFAYGASIVRQNLGFSTNLNTFWTATNSSNARSAVGLGATWLTNTNVTNFRTAIGLGANDTISFGNVNALQVVVAGTNIAETGIISGGGFYVSDENTNTTAEVFIFGGDAENRLRANARTNLSLGATWLTNTNVTNFRSAIGLGASNEVTFEAIVGGSGSINVVNGEFMGAWYFDDSVSFGAPNVVRTNVGLPLAALTNTSNVTAMRALSGSTNTNHPFSGSVSVVGTNNTNTLVFSNGILQEVQ